MISLKASLNFLTAVVLACLFPSGLTQAAGIELASRLLDRIFAVRHY